jgi:hypothetical protein
MTEEPRERRWGWAKPVSTAFGVFVEHSLRNTALLVAALMSVAAILTGATANSTGWVVAGVLCGLGGLVLAFLPLLRRWSLAWQWTLLVVVIAGEIAFLVLSDRV